LGLIVIETHRRPPGALASSQIWLRWGVAMSCYLGVGLFVAMRPIGDGWLTGASWVLGLLGGELVARLRSDSSLWLKSAINLLSATVALSPLVIELPNRSSTYALRRWQWLPNSSRQSLNNGRHCALRLRFASRSRAMAAELHDVIAHGSPVSSYHASAGSTWRSETAGQRALGKSALVATHWRRLNRALNGNR
jgi:hypothetical protein